MQLYNIESAAKVLCISPWTVRAAIRDGRLRPVRIGRRVLLEEADLSRFIAGSRQGENGRADDVPVMA